MEPDLALLDRYLAGDCTQAEAATVRRWLDAHPDARVRLTDIAEVRDVAVTGMLWDVDAGWRGMTAQIALEDTETEIIPPRSVSVPQQPHGVGISYHKSQEHTARRWYTTAGLAVAAIFTLIAGWSWKQSATSAAPSQRVSTYTTGNGQRSTITLSDGSRVVLNVGSRLDVPVDYDRGNRTLRLSGEALFTVTHREGTPFTVRTNSSTTRVLGTSFIVRDYDTDTAATIAVRDGKVMVRSTVLTAMQQVTESASGTGSVHNADSAQFTFATGVLTLPDLPLVEAIPALNRWYDTEIRLGDRRLASRRIAGGFNAGSVTDLTNILELTYNVRAVREGRVLTLYPKH